MIAQAAFDGGSPCPAIRIRNVELDILCAFIYLYAHTYSPVSFTVPTSSKDWQNRQEAIRSILARSPVSSQDDLCRSLRAKGFRVTQSSVSRDLAELHAAKLDGRYVLTDTFSELTTRKSALQEAAEDIREVRTAGANLLVVLTPAGRASSVGLAIDRAGWTEIVGTVAGDDTLFIAVSGRRHQTAIQARLLALPKKARS